MVKTVGVDSNMTVGVARSDANGGKISKRRQRWKDFEATPTVAESSTPTAAKITLPQHTSQPPLYLSVYHFANRHNQQQMKTPSLPIV